MGKFTRRQVDYIEQFEQLDHDTIDLYIRKQRDEIKLGYMSQDEIKLLKRQLYIAKLVRRWKRKELESK